MVKTTIKHKKINIKDTVDLSNQGILLVTDNSIQRVFHNSGPLAKNNEFQEHYWSFNIRFTGNDGSVLDIAIPTVYFNYPQEVSSAHIDFDMKDVKEMSEKVFPLHKAKYIELMNSGIVEKLEALLMMKAEIMSVDFNSIHTHP